MTLLSILIPTIPERKAQFDKLYDRLMAQIDKLELEHPSLGGVIIESYISPKFINGGVSVGVKRNQLIQNATGSYCCFLDDDDWIAPNYLETLVRLCNDGIPDVVTFKSLFTCDTYWGVANLKLHNPNEEATPEFEFKRNAWHICPIRTSIAKQFEFSNINNAEDWDWFKNVLPLLRSERHSDYIIHQYNHSSLISAVDEIDTILK